MSYETALATYTAELNRLLAIDVDPAEAAVQAYKFTDVRELMETGRPMRWTFGGKIVDHGPVLEMTPSRSEVHAYGDQRSGAWVDRGVFGEDADTMRLP